MTHYKSLFIYIFTVSAGLFMSCTPGEKSVYPPEPEIRLLSYTDSVFNFLDETSCVTFLFELRDGDKDMGLSDKDSVFVFEDHRSDTLYQALYLGMAEIPRETIDGPTLWADVEIPLRSFYFVPRGDSLHISTMSDTLVFKIYAVDNAGHKSNVIVSDTMYIFP